MTRIYFADLTHTTVTISNDSFPLNIGLVAAYARGHYPDIDVNLFKFPDRLLFSIEKKAPTILALSNYPWNHSCNIAFARYVKKINKNIITVLGGPYISYNRAEQASFLSQYRDIVDFYAMYEGETSFKQILDSAFLNDFDVRMMKTAPIPGCLYINDDGELCDFQEVPRSRALDEFPSPYLTGLLDPFFKEKLSPLIETHRGCPYRCTYCHEGHLSYSKVNCFGTKRVLDEIDYIAEHASVDTRALLVADPNFGMFERDIEIAQKIREVHDRTGYPKIIFATSAKNKKDNLIDISKAIEGISMPIWMSVQSLTDNVLANIKRRNISTSDMLSVQNALRGANQLTQSELIMCLPGETFYSHFKSIVGLMEMKIDKIACYQLMILNGSDMKASFDNSNEFGFVTKWRVLPRSFTDLPGVGRSIETEQIVVATNTFSFEDYIVGRQLHLLTSVFYSGGPFQGFFRLVQELGIDVGAFLFTLLERFQTHPQLSELLASFVQDTKRELFDTETEMIAYYGIDENFRKLVSGEDGANLLQTYTSRAYLEHGTTLVETIAGALLASAADNPKIVEKAKEISRYYTLSFMDFLSPDRLEICHRSTFNYDISSWLTGTGTIDDARFVAPAEVEFFITVEQYQLLEDLRSTFGQGPQAFGKILSRMWVGEMLRKSRIAADLGGEISSRNG